MDGVSITNSGCFEFKEKVRVAIHGGKFVCVRALNSTLSVASIIFAFSNSADNGDCAVLERQAICRHYTGLSPSHSMPYVETICCLPDTVAEGFMGLGVVVLVIQCSLEVLRCCMHKPNTLREQLMEDS
jgi:hypothetical protein